MTDEKWHLNEEEKAVKEELMRLALSQNPQLAQRLLSITARQHELKRQEMLQRIATYEAWLEEQKRKREPRKIRYDDRRNINALKGLRRSNDYKYSTRERQIEMEIKYYYSPMNLPVPEALRHEMEEIALLKQSAAPRAG